MKNKNYLYIIYLNNEKIEKVIYDNFSFYIEKYLDKYKENKKKYNISKLGFCYLKLILNKKYNLDINKLILKTNKNGKPYFENSKINFNISNKKNIISIILSDKNCGVDIEEYKTISSSRNFCQKIGFYNKKCLSEPIKYFNKKEALLKKEGLTFFDNFKLKNKVFTKTIKYKNNFYYLSYSFKGRKIIIKRFFDSL